jgi:cell division protein FtsB
MNTGSPGTDDHKHLTRLKSVDYVSALSLWALVAGHWSTWQAARVEVTQQKEMQKLEDSPIEQRVVEKIVEETALEPTP